MAWDWVFSEHLRDGIDTLQMTAILFHATAFGKHHNTLTLVFDFVISVPQQNGAQLRER